MIDLTALPVFLAAALAINLTPGPSVLYVTTIALARGCWAGILSAFGLMGGILVHVVAAAAGLSVVLASSATAFLVVKVLGAAYLIFLGLRLLLAKAETPATQAGRTKAGLWPIFLQGVLVDLLNPKIALFFLAFLPQFVDPAVGPAFLQTLLLGGLFAVLGTAVNCLFALFAATTLGGLRRRGRALIGRWLPGAVLIGLGLRLAAAES